MRRLDARSMGPVFLYLCWSFSELASSIYHTQCCSAAVSSCFLSSLCLLRLRLPLLLLVTVVRWEPSKMQVDHCQTCSSMLAGPWKSLEDRHQKSWSKYEKVYVNVGAIPASWPPAHNQSKKESGVQKWATNQPYMHSLMGVRLVAAVGSGSLVDE